MDIHLERSGFGGRFRYGSRNNSGTTRVGVGGDPTSPVVSHRVQPESRPTSLLTKSVSLLRMTL